MREAPLTLEKIRALAEELGAPPMPKRVWMLPHHFEKLCKPGSPPQPWPVEWVGIPVLTLGCGESPRPGDWIYTGAGFIDYAKLRTAAEQGLWTTSPLAWRAFKGLLDDPTAPGGGK